MSLSVAMLTVSSYVYFGVKLDIFYIITVFLGSNGVYHFHRLSRHIYFSEKASEERLSFLDKFMNHLGITMTLSLGYAFYHFFFNCNWREALVWVVIVGFSVVFYTIPFIKTKNKWWSLRKLPYLKTFLIAFIWSVVTVSIPYEMSGEIKFDNHWILFFSNFLLIFSLTLPFDFRDIEYDGEENILKKHFADRVDMPIIITLNMFVWAGFTYIFLEPVWSLLIAVLVFLKLVPMLRKNAPDFLFTIALESIPILYVISLFVERGFVIT
ncbi:MAG: hypothetical protein N4A45_09890 [Flavobacteriales bacterium]|jgi:hypothetical protein|nr:hypothetical protein [Flavobacteriales bacterium]